MNILRKVDFLGPPMRVTIKGEDRFTSNSGGIMTILLACLVVLTFCAFGRDIIERKQPNITYNSKINDDRRMLFNTSAHDFTVMYAITNNQNMAPIQDIHRKMNLFFNVRNTNISNAAISETGSNLIDKTWPMISCGSRSNNPEALKNLLVDVNYYLCPPEGLVYDFINGLGEGESQWFRIQMAICKNTTENNNHCLPAEEIHKEFRVINLHYILSDVTVDGYNYTTPVSPTFISGLVKGGANTWARTVYWYKNVFYKTDVSWILEDYIDEKHMQFAQLDKEIYFRENTNVFFSHLISLKIKADYYNRSYLKIQGVFAYIGGFITFFKIVFENITKVIISQDLILIFNSEKNKIARQQKRLHLSSNNVASSDIGKKLPIGDVIDKAVDQFGRKPDDKPTTPKNENSVSTPRHLVSHRQKEQPSMNNFVSNNKGDSTNRYNHLNDKDASIVVKPLPKSVTGKFESEDIRIPIMQYVMPFMVSSRNKVKSDTLQILKKRFKEVFSLEEIISTVMLTKKMDVVTGGGKSPDNL